MSTVSNRAFPWTFVLNERMRILVVDDDPILREFASVYLATPCAMIDTACDVAAARLQLRDNDYDIVLLDIEMPQVDGFALLEEIRSSEKLKHLPVIMLTGHDDIISIDRAYQTGANSFATKPVNWRQLSYQVRYVVRTCGRRADQHLAEPASGSAPRAVDGDVRAFLRSVVNRVNALGDGLSGHDRERFAELLQNLSSIAERALGERPGQAPDSPPNTRCAATIEACHAMVHRS